MLIFLSSIKYFNIFVFQSRIENIESIKSAENATLENGFISQIKELKSNHDILMKATRQRHEEVRAIWVHSIKLFPPLQSLELTVSSTF